MRLAWLVLLLGCGQPTARTDGRAVETPTKQGEARTVDAGSRGKSPADAEPPGASRDDRRARDSGPREIDLAAAPTSASTSIGSPNDGRIEGGVAFPAEGPGFMHNPRRTNPEARWGTVEMVRGLVRAAAVVETELPGSRLVVNDLSLPGGGPIAHHGSHRSGRDVDVLFYLSDTDGNPIPSVGVPLDPRGKGWDFKDRAVREDDVRVRMDLVRTWRFLQALAEDPEAQLQRVFVAEHLRTLLLEQAARVRAARAAVDRLGEAMCQPGTPHDDHLHLRFFCTAEDVHAGCEDSYPIYPWHRRAMVALGAEPVRATLRRDRPRSRTVSAAEARRKAGKMHWLVTDFLDKREAWSKQPHPGRPWCP